MAIVFNTGVANYFGAPAPNPATVTPVIPSGVHANDLLLLFVVLGGTGYTIPTPTGWTSLGSATGSTQGQLFVFWKIAVSGDIGFSLAITYTNASAAKIGTIIAARSGVSTTSPIQSSSIVAETVNRTTHTTPTLTFSSIPSTRVDMVMDRISPANTAWTIPGAMTLREQFYGTGTDVSAASSDIVISTSGSNTGNTYTSTSSSINAIMVGIALNAITSTSQTARPITDITSTGWTKVPSGAASFSATVGETTEDDTSYVQSPANSNGTQVFESKLASMSVPTDLNSIVLTLALQSVSASACSCVISLIQGTTVVATWTEPGVTSSVLLFAYGVSATQAATITDWTDLRVRLNVTVS